jgi:hypothetical protein
MRSALLIAALLASPALAQRETASFLKIQPGARPMAMGEAYTALADDMNAMTTNPAGLARLQSQQAVFQHAELFAGTKYEYAGYARPVDFTGGGVMGVSVGHLSHPRLEGRDASGNPTGSFSAGDTVVSLGYSARLPSYPAVLGANVKFIESTLADAKARTYAVDLGAQRAMDFLHRSARFGVAVRNLGPGLKFASETNPLPLMISVGGSVNVVGAMNLALDVHQEPNSRRTGVAVGTEYAIMPAFALRSGYSSSSANGGGNLSALGGLGMGFGLRVYKATLDYSFSPYGELGSAQRLSLSSRF